MRDYRGKQMSTHTGGLPGYLSRVAMLPELRLGVVVLTNQESGAAFNALAYRVLDHFLGAKAPDYVGIYQKLREQTRARLAKLARRRGSRARLDVRPFAPARRSTPAPTATPGTAT